MEERKPIEKQLVIDTQCERVWDALTQAEELVRWFPAEARVTPGEGGEIWMSWGEGAEGASKIEIWEPNRRLRTTWPSANGPLTVDYYLEARGESTVLRLVHSGFGKDAKWDEEYDGIDKGWSHELRSLKFYIENHAGRDRHAAWPKITIDTDLDEAWKRITGPHGLIRNVDTSALHAGDPVDIETSIGEKLEGSVFVDPPRNELSLIVDSLGGSMVRFGVESCFGIDMAYVWMASYDLPATTVDDYGQRWQQELNRLFQGVEAAS